MIKKRVMNGYGTTIACYDMNIPDHESAQCGLCYADEDGTIALISYTTNVCGYNPITGEKYCNGTFSATTRKHIGWFCHYINTRYGANTSYQEMKKISKE